MQAYNANGWGASSPSASFATVTWPLASHAAPPRVPRVNAGSCMCGGKLYVAGGQSVGSGGGVGGPVRIDIAQPGLVHTCHPLPASCYTPLPGVCSATMTRCTRYLVITPYQVLGALEEYDLASRTWVRRAEMTTPRSHLALACVLNTTLVAVRSDCPFRYHPLATAPLLPRLSCRSLAAARG